MMQCSAVMLFDIRFRWGEAKFKKKPSYSPENLRYGRTTDIAKTTRLLDLKETEKIKALQRFFRLHFKGKFVVKSWLNTLKAGFSCKVPFCPIIPMTVIYYCVSIRIKFCRHNILIDQNTCGKVGKAIFKMNKNCSI